ncbi:MAG: glycosyltransferase [Cyanobacteriota bacterium]|nr:glycosyltransferase [Cyanobacteriota bacterium]
MRESTPQLPSLAFARVKRLIRKLLNRRAPLQIKRQQNAAAIRSLFSEGYYRGCHHDIPLTISAFLHFLDHGVEEGRNPNPFLSFAFIRQQLPALAALSNRELLSKQHLDQLELSSTFDSPYYRELYAEQLRDFPGSALAHYLEIGYSRGYRTSRRTLVVPQWLQRLVASSATCRQEDDHRLNCALNRRILVVIPVYQDEAKTRACIASLYQRALPPGVRVIVVNDCSPDPVLAQFLQAASQEYGFELIINASNLGFTGSVNLANSRRSSDEDLLLVNADTLLPIGLIPRLAAYLDRDDRVATVTPLSNNATIATLPCIGEDLQFFHPHDLDHLDWAASHIASAAALLDGPVEVPTAVGFCMLIRHQAIPAGELFDVALFGKGYGEENYFCLKATEAGFRHVLAHDVFVWHHGGASFGAEKWPQIEKASQILDRHFPHYRSSVSRFCQNDKLLMHRLAVTLLALAAGGSYSGCLIVTHELGGGIERYLRDRAEKLQPGQFLLIFKPSEVRSFCAVNFVAKTFVLSLAIDVGEPEDTALALRDLFPLRSVEFHSIIGHDSEFLYQLIEVLELPFTTLLHDYTAVCPRVQPRDANDIFCGLPDAQTCNRCLAQNCDRSRLKSDISTWRYRHQWLLYGAERLIAPSRNTADAYQRLLPGLAIDVQPHEDQEAILLQRVRSRLRIQQRPGSLAARRLMVLGSLTAHKGLHLLEEVCRHLGENPPEVVLIGALGQPSPLTTLEHVFVYGAYADRDLPQLIDQFTPAVIFFPARWPETYSYTLSDALRSGYPVLAPDVGAFSERMAGLPDCQLYRLSDSPQAIASQLLLQLPAAPAGHRPAAVDGADRTAPHGAHLR